MAEQSETPVLDLIARMTADSIETSGLDGQTLVLVRIAALVAVDAPPASYMLNLGAAGEVGVDEEQVRGVLAAVAPIVGTARVASATGNIVAALGLAIELAELRRRPKAREQTDVRVEPARDFLEPGSPFTLVLRRAKMFAIPGAGVRSAGTTRGVRVERAPDHGRKDDA